MTVYRKTGQIISKENLDVINVLEMNGFIQKNDDGDFGENLSIPADKLDEAMTFLRDYYIVLGRT